MEATGSSSRSSAARAGWDEDGNPRTGVEAKRGSWVSLLEERENPRWDSFSWLTVRALFESVNDVFAKFRPDIVDARRARWVAAQRSRGARGAVDLVVRRYGPLPRALFVIGDTGEQDASQYALAPYLTAGSTQSDPDGNARKPEFMLIASDVIYPAGDVNEYVNGFYIPYKEFRQPILALPGNHDWYDGLDGFMYHFCGAEPLPAERFRSTEVRPGTRLARSLWRRAAAPDRQRLSRWRDSRASDRDETRAVQPGPYFAIDLGDLMLVNIDTGVSGTIDDEQGRWLVEISKAAKQKILITGKPLYVNGAYHPCEIAWRPPEPGGAPPTDPPAFATVDDVVRCGAHGYVAAIGGDVHNYQRYPIRFDDGRTIQYLVSGGGGAYLSPTHRIGPVGKTPETTGHEWPEGLTMPRDEDQHDDPYAADPERFFRCYPQRGDSLAYTARRAGPRIFNAAQLAAAALVAATAVLFFALPLDADESWGLAVAYLPLLLGAAVFVGVSQRVEGSKPADKKPEQGQSPHWAVTVILATLAVYALFAWGAGVAGDAQLGSARFWSAAAIAMVIPVSVVAAILLSHDLRGSVPSGLPQLCVAAGFVSALLIFLPLSGTLSAPDWLVTLLAVTFGLAMVNLALELARGRWLREKGPVAYRFLDRALVAASPLTLATALVLRTDRDRAIWIFVALVFTAGWPLLWAIGRGTLAPLRVAGASEIATRFEGAALYVAAVGWIAVGALLLHLIGDGWLAATAAGAVSSLTIAAVTVVLFVLARNLLWRFGLCVIGVLVVVSAAFVAGGVTWLAFAAVSTLLLGGVVVVAWPLGGGSLNARGSQAAIRDRLRLAQSGASAATEPSPHREDSRYCPLEGDTKLFDLLYPYRWEDRQEGAQKTGSLSQTRAKLLAELGDSDEPPFFKHFLRMDLRSASTSADGCDRELTVRAFGVTGFAKDERNPPVEDELKIRFRSPKLFEEELESL